jgi:hypothetical protein
MSFFLDDLETPLSEYVYSDSSPPEVPILQGGPDDLFPTGPLVVPLEDNLILVPASHSFRTAMASLGVDPCSYSGICMIRMCDAATLFAFVHAISCSVPLIVHCGHSDSQSDQSSLRQAAAYLDNYGSFS